MAEMFQIFMRSLRGMWVGFVASLPALLAGILVFGLFAILGRVAGAVIRRAGARIGMDGSLVLLLVRIASFLLLLFGGLVAAVVAVPTFRPGDLIAGLGITTVAIGFAFKDILQNFFAGVLILWRRPFHVGDEIRSGEYEGIVEAIDARSTQIRTFDGERAFLPNGDVFARAILVRTAHPQRRGKFVIGIGYSASIEDAQAAILAAVAATEEVLEDPAPAVYVTDFSPSSVDLTVYFWLDAHRSSLLKVKHRVAVAVKRALDEAGIEIPFPQRVVTLREEGA
jgi:small-conductance mechanosensitive channel